MDNSVSNRPCTSSNEGSNQQPQASPSFYAKVINAVAVCTMTMIASNTLENGYPSLASMMRWIGGGIGLICLFQRSVKPPPPPDSIIQTRQEPIPVSMGSVTISDKTFTFKKIESQTLVSIKNHRKNTVAEMRLDKSSFKEAPYHLFSEREKINWLLKNHHFEMVCKKRESKVFFSLINPALLEWKIIEECAASESNRHGQVNAPYYTQKALGFTSLNISSFCRLIDGTIALGCKKGEFYIYSIKGNCLFSLNFQKEIKDIIEYTNGMLEVKTIQSTFILRPKKKVDPVLLEIKKLKGEIKHSPYNFSLYQTLASRYKILGDPKEIKIYQQGVKAAARCLHRYRARRFIEQFTTLNPDKKIECYQTYFNNLGNSKVNRAEERAVCIKLYNLLQKEQEKLLETLPKVYAIEKIRVNNQKMEELLNRIRRFVKKGYKTRLLIGEGNFTYTEDLIKVHQKTHPGLGGSIIATELHPPTETSIHQRITSLMNQGVAIYYKVDAKMIHMHFKQRIPRIHWNCPNGGGTEKMKEQFKGTVIQFFQSGSQLQKVRDRIHITLLQEPDKWIFRQIQCDLVKAVTEPGYRLVGKRLFHERYYKYQHKKTVGNQSIDAAKREFVFEKVQANRLNRQEDLISKAQKLCDPEVKEFQIGFQKNNREQCYFDCSTDDDSSDYYDSDDSD